MSSSDTELEQQLREAGNRLMDPSPSVEELLPLLDQVENCLSRVEQSPSQSMQDALSPSLKALVTEQIFRHPDADVKVAVASCISEITRITAPDAPYEDEQMKEVFQLIVSSFENLFDKSSRSYAKRTSILETVAKVRSCVVMLDLECDALIIEMFQHFFKTIRDYHPENVFSSMETIMTLVLEESEDISMELLSPLLACVKKDNEEVMPIARKLAERVLQTCVDKLKPCLTQAVKTLGISLDDYSGVIASICEDSSNHISQDDGAINKQVTHESKPAGPLLDDAAQEDQDNSPGEVDLAEEVDLPNDKSTKSVANNGVVQEDDSLRDSSLKKQEHGPDESSIDASTVHQSSNLSLENIVDLDNAEKDTDKRTSASSKSTGPSKSSNADDKEGESLAEQKCEEKHDPDSHHEDPSVTAVSSMENQEVSGDKSSPKVTEGVIDEVASPTRSGTAADENLKKQTKKEVTIETEASDDGVSKTGSEGRSESEVKSSRLAKKKTASGVRTEDKILSAIEETKCESSGASDLEAKPELIKIPNEGTRDSETKSSKQLGKMPAPGVSDEDKVQPAEVETKEESGGASDLELKQPKQPIMTQKEQPSDSEVKVSRRKGKKAAPRVSSEDKTPSLADDTKEEERGGLSDSEAKPLKQAVKKKVNNTKDNGEKSVSKHPADKKKRSRGKDVLEKAEQKSPERTDIEEMDVSPKSLNQNNDEPHLEQTPKAASKRKTSASKEKASGSVEYNETLVGFKVKVWWPKDKMFYEGIIDSFDPIKKKHKVLYNDGDQEILNLRREKWEFMADENGSSEDEGTDHASPDASPEMPQKKRMKAAEKSTEQSHVDASQKKAGVATSSKSKGAATKSGQKLRDAAKSDGRPRGGSKSGSKPENDLVTRTKDHTPKTGSSRTADSSSKAVGKSRNDDSNTPKSGKSKEDGSDLIKSTKSKDDASKSARSKQETPKISSGKVLQSGKSSGNVANKRKSGSLKTTESESVKEDSPKAGSKSKSSKKQRR